MAFSQSEWEEMKRDVSAMKASIQTLQLNEATRGVEFSHLKAAVASVQNTVAKLNTRNTQLSVGLAIFMWLTSSGIIDLKGISKIIHGEPPNATTQQVPNGH